MVFSPPAFELAEVPDLQCPSRAVTDILDFVEAVTNRPLKNLVVQDIDTPETALPFRALLEWVEASCECRLQRLVIVDSEELRTYRTKLLQRVQESYTRQHDDFVRENSSPHLHYRIVQLQAELSKAYASLKEQQTELAALRSAHGKQLLGASVRPKDIDTESDSEPRIIPKRRRLSRRSDHFGMDGIDEQTMDDPRRETKSGFSWSHDASSSSRSRSQQRVPAPYLPRDNPSAHSCPRSGRKFHRGAMDTRSPRGSTLTESGYDYLAAYGSSNHAALEGIWMPPPSQSRTYAPGLAIRKAKGNEYDPLGRLMPKDFYPLRKKKEDAAVTGTWTTIDPDDNLRNWDTLKEQERS